MLLVSLFDIYRNKYKGKNFLRERDVYRFIGGQIKRKREKPLFTIEMLLFQPYFILEAMRVWTAYLNFDKSKDEEKKARKKANDQKKQARTSDEEVSQIR